MPLPTATIGLSMTRPEANRSALATTHRASTSSGGIPSLTRRATTVRVLASRENPQWAKAANVVAVAAGEPPEGIFFSAFLCIPLLEDPVTRPAMRPVSIFSS